MTGFKKHGIKKSKKPREKPVLFLPVTHNNA